MRTLFLSTAVAAALALGLPAMTANAQTAPQQATVVASENTFLSVSAQAEASAVPDIARINVGVVTQGADANAAMRANAEQMDKVMSAVRAAGIASRDIQTGGINLYPQYRHVENEAPVITSYQANNSVNLRVRDIAKLGQVLDALAAAGANQINGPSFEVDQTEPLYDQARMAALDKARARAELYAQRLGMRVLRIVSVSEGGGGMGVPRPMYAMAAPAARMQADTSVSPGESTLSANLEVVFELGR